MNKSVAKLLVILLMFAGEAIAAPDLLPHSAEYKVKINVLSARLNTSLVAGESGYTATHVIKPTGMSRLLTRGTMDVTSNFAVAASGVQPISYQAIDTIRDDPAVDLTFDWESDHAFGNVGDEAVNIELDGIAHDSVSIQYQLMHDLLTGKTPDEYTLFDIDELKSATISQAGNKTIKTKAGQFEAIGVRHQKEGSSRITTLWCVEELGYLPVVIEQHRKGKLNFQATLLKYTPTVVEQSD